MDERQRSRNLTRVEDLARVEEGSRSFNNKKIIPECAIDYKILQDVAVNDKLHLEVTPSS